MFNPKDQKFSDFQRGGAHLFDNAAQLLTNALGLAEGAKREVETIIRTQLERLILAMNVATREELDVLRDQIAALQIDNAALKARLAKLDEEETPIAEASSPKSDETSGPEPMLPNA